MRTTGVLTAMAITGLLAGCGGGGDLLLPGTGEPATVTLVQGDDQNGRVGEALPQPLVAAVADAAGRPLEGATVVFLLTDPAPGAVISPDTVTTDADGHATAAVVLGTRPGAQAGEVRALGGSGAPTATTAFTLTALSEDANGIRAVSGDGQSAPVGATLAEPLVVEVADAFGNPIPNVTVGWSIEGGGSVSEAQTTTGADGLTSVQRTLGTSAGTQRTLATVDGLAGSPVAFLHTATAGSASGVTIVSGDDQTGSVSTELAQDLVVQVRDAQGNPVPSVAVTWVIGTGGGSVTPSTSTTDAAGRASAAWTLGAAPGANTVSAVVSGIGVVEFSATATAGAPARLTVRTQPSASVVSGVLLSQQPIVQLLDAQGNEARQGGVQVSVAIASGGGALGGTTTVPTDGDGRATFTDLSLSGPAGTRTLRFSASGFASVTSSPIVVSAAATVTTITADTPDPSQAGGDVTVQITVASSVGTPTGSVRVSDGADACTASLSGGQGSCTLTLGTAGNRTLIAEYQGSDGFAPSSDTEGHVVEAPPAPELAVARQPSATATIGVPFEQQPIVQLQNADGSALSTGGVAVSVAIATGGGTLSGTTTRTTDGSGRAEFTDLAINGDPGQRTLVFTATGYGTTNSTAIDVGAPAPTLGLSLPPGQPSSGTLDVPLSPAPVVQLLSDGAPAATAGVEVTASILSGGGSLAGAATATTDAQGRAVFADLAIGGEPGARTLRFTAADYGSVDSPSIDVQAAAPPPGS